MWKRVAAHIVNGVVIFVSYGVALFKWFTDWTGRGEVVSTLGNPGSFLQKSAEFLLGAPGYFYAAIGSVVLVAWLWCSYRVLAAPGSDREHPAGSNASLEAKSQNPLNEYRAGPSLQFVFDKSSPHYVDGLDRKTAPFGATGYAIGVKNISDSTSIQDVTVTAEPGRFLLYINRSARRTAYDANPFPLLSGPSEIHPNSVHRLQLLVFENWQDSVGPNKSPLWDRQTFQISARGRNAAEVVGTFEWNPEEWPALRMLSVEEAGALTPPA